MRTARTIAIIMLLCVAVPGAASARCQGAVALGALHDAYRATLFEQGTTQFYAAQSLLVIAGQQDPATFASRVAHSGASVSIQRLSDVLDEAVALAKQVLNKGSGVAPTFGHGRNVEWLGDLYAATGCTQSRSAASLPIAVERQPTVDPARPPDPSWFGPSAVGWWAAAIAAVAVFAAWRLSRSLLFRKTLADRLPRYSITEEVAVVYADPDGNVNQDEVDALDISRGGLKLHWPDAPLQGTDVTLTVLGEEKQGSVAWTNSHYAGVVFETLLSEQQLTIIKDDEPTD